MRGFCSLLIVVTTWACTRSNPSFGLEGGGSGGSGSFDTGTPSSGAPVSEASSNASAEESSAGAGFCGDGMTDAEEACDDGENNGADGSRCTSDCQLDVCGDGHRGPDEGCDDGNDIDDDGCTNMCRLASCGNGEVDPPEQCDDGNDNNSDDCIDTCIKAKCGDTYKFDGHEECDDGNSENTDACLNTCEAAICGDTFIKDGVETCDDGNDIDTDECTNDCQLPACNDGTLSASESCDPSVKTPTCEELGYGSGNTSCADSCVIISECCGDETVSQGNGEECDDPSNTFHACAELDLIGDGTVNCTPSCTWEPTNPGDCCLPLGAACGNFPLSGISCCEPASCSNAVCVQG